MTKFMIDSASNMKDLATDPKRPPYDENSTAAFFSFCTIVLSNDLFFSKTSFYVALVCFHVQEVFFPASQVKDQDTKVTKIPKFLFFVYDVYDA